MKVVKAVASYPKTTKLNSLKQYSNLPIQVRCARDVDMSGDQNGS